MFSSRRRHVSLLLLPLALIGSLLAAGGTAANDAPVTQRCIGYCTYPTNAAKVFKWGLSAWEDEFIDGGVDGQWRSDHPELVEELDGMLAVNALPDTGSVRVWTTSQKAKVGRWEARMSAVDRLPDVGLDYRFYWELVPVGAAHCGGQDVVLANYKVGDERAAGYTRSLPHNEFRFSRAVDLQWGAWHAYAIEIRKKRISWFVDTKVVRTERRPEALSGVTLRPQFRIVGVPGETMREASLQFDWVRYYTLERPNAKPVTAPRMRKATFKKAC